MNVRHILELSCTLAGIGYYIRNLGTITVTSIDTDDKQASADGNGFYTVRGYSGANAYSDDGILLVFNTITTGRLKITASNGIMYRSKNGPWYNVTMTQITT